MENSSQQPILSRFFLYATRLCVHFDVDIIELCFLILIIK